jgi:signal transduction histidine kinase/ligand-binding sensor domain-containing protein/AraC-like DNA-binding protein
MNNSKIYSAILTLVFLFALATRPFASQTEMIIECLSERIDLPKGSINCIEQDSTGFVWIGTWKGLYRYDGYSVINFAKINPRFDALKITSLHVSGNYLWVGSFVSGLYRVDLNSYQIRHYHSLAPDDSKITNNDVISIASGADGRLALGTERGGLTLIDKNGNIAATFNTNTSPQILTLPQVSNVVFCNDSLVVFSNQNLVFLNPGTGHWRTYSHPEFSAYITAIVPVRSDEFLIGSNNGFFRVKINGEQCHLTKLLSYRTNSLIKGSISSPNTYLVGTTEGIFEYNLDRGEVNRFRIVSDRAAPQHGVNALKETFDQTVFIGTENGLYALIPRRQFFKHAAIEAPNDVPVAISSIRKANHTIFAGSWGQGLLSMTKAGNSLVPVTFSNSEQFSPQYIYTLHESDGVLWFSCKNYQGIFRFDPSQKPYLLKHYPYFLNHEGHQQQYMVTSVAESKEGELFFGTWEGVLFRYNKKTDQFNIVTNRNGELPASKNLSVFSMLEDTDGKLWVGTSGGGAYIYKIEGCTFVEEQKITRENGLVSNFITQIVQTRNGRIWIGTEEGLSFVENGKLESVFHHDFVVDVQSLSEDPIGFLWVGTQKGIIRLDSNNPLEPAKRFDQTDGLKNRSFYLNSIENDDDFTFYFGGYDGIDYFTPYKIEFNYKKPAPRITGFSLFNTDQFPDMPGKKTVLSANIQHLHELTLTHNQNTFSFEFSNLEYQNPEKCQFAYMMQGVDNEWNYRDAANRTAYFTKLSPGKYTFMVKSTNNDGVWNEQPTQLSIVVLPPWWRTTWAYIGYFIVAMLGVFLFTYLLIKRVEFAHRQQLNLLEVENQKELNEMKTMFFTNISHEFRTPLTLIMGPIAQILGKEKNDPFHEQHLMIFRNAKRLLHLTNRIMDFRKSEKEQLKLKVEQAYLTDFLRNIFLFFKYEAEKRTIKYYYTSSLNDHVWFDKEFVESIAFNMLSNAFKFTPNGHEIALSVRIDTDSVLLTFSNTGASVDDKQQIFNRFYSTAKKNSTGVGLDFTKKLIELHKGSISVESEGGAGTVFTVALPLFDVYSDDEKASPSKSEEPVCWENSKLERKTEAVEHSRKIKSLFKKNALLVMVVDDNLDVRLFVRSLLDQEYTIVDAENGEEAFAMAVKLLPDLVISDVMMPGMNGLELCEKLKTDIRTDHIPVILTTVLSAQSDRIQGLEKGADSYIPKPIDPQHLQVRVRKLIEKQLRLREKFNLSNYEADENRTVVAESVHPLIEKAREVILKNIDNSDYSIDHFSNDLGLSRMQLYRKFKTITGLSANSFIRKVRLHRAAEMIKTGNFSIKEVTYDVGFTDLKYFRRCFFEEFGVNPSEYGNP